MRSALESSAKSVILSSEPLVTLLSLTYIKNRSVPTTDQWVPAVFISFGADFVLFTTVYFFCQINN